MNIIYAIESRLWIVFTICFDRLCIGFVSIRL